MPLQNDIWREDLTPEEKAEAEKKLHEWLEENLEKILGER